MTSFLNLLAQDPAAVEATQAAADSPVEVVEEVTTSDVTDAVADTVDAVQTPSTNASTVEAAQEAVAGSAETSTETGQSAASNTADVVQDSAVTTVDAIKETAASSPTDNPATDNPVADSLQDSANQLSANHMDLAPFLITVAIAIGLGLAFYTVIYTLLRNVFRQFKSDLPLVALGTSRLPLTLVIIALGLNVAFGQLPASLGTGALLLGLEKVLSALAILSVTYWITELFRKVVIYALKQYAADSEAAWDDVLVPFIETAVPIVLYIGGAFLAFQAVGVDLSGIWVALGGLSFVLGFAAQGILSNFFSGLVLLIDTPGYGPDYCKNRP